MAGTRFKIADRSDIFLYMTRVENLFINEFLPVAPGEYVKLYLYALMCAQYEEELDTAVLARTLGMQEFEIEEAWDYWEACGLIRRNKETSTIEFIRMVEKLYGKNRSYAQAASEPPAAEELVDDGTGDNFDDEDVDIFYDFDSTSGGEEKKAADAERQASEKAFGADPAERTPGTDRTDRSKRIGRTDSKLMISEQLRQIFARFQEVSGRTISRRETEKLTDTVNVYEVKPEVLYYAIDYCADIDNYSADYISKVAIRWKDEGCEDRESVKVLLEKHSKRNKAYREVFKAVGFNRLTTPADREIMDRWFDEMGFGLEEVLEACRATGGIREPSLRYVNKILENKMLEKGGVKTPASGSEAGRTSGAGDAKVSRKVLRDYYQHIRDEEEAARSERIREAETNIPGMEELLEKESELNAKAVSLMMGGSAEERARLREERKRLTETRKSLLAAAGYPADYLEKRHRCNICKDSGYTDEGTVCSCCRARADEAYLWNLERSKA